MRAAIYARYSSDNQEPRSIDDQVQLCRELAARHGYTIADIYTDYEISGETLMKIRPGALRLLRDAEARKFDVLLSEALDRISRDLADVADFYKRFVRFAGGIIVTAEEGEIDELKIGFKGTMNSQILRGLAQKVRRGQRGRVRAGLAPGGVGYGYRVKKVYDDKGEPIRGHREIAPDQAEIVRRIFTEYADGRSAFTIAAALNRERIPGPAGNAWGATTINGSRARGIGILNNEAYIGILVYNHVTFVKHPDTGKRRSRLNPESQWLRQEAPGLRIVSDDLWAHVKARQGQYAHRPMGEAHRPVHLFSGLLKCGVCGGTYTVVNRDTLGCSSHRQKGTCDNNRRIARIALERRVLNGLRRHLLAPEAISAFVAEYHAERERLAAAQRGRRDQLARRINRLSAGIARLIDAIRHGAATPASNAALVADEAEKQNLETELGALDGASRSVVAMHPAAIAAYQQRVIDLAAALGRDSSGAAAQIVRGLVDHITISPDATPRGVAIEAHGLLAELVSYAAENTGGTKRTLTMVAGVGFEPTTFRL